MEIDLMAGRDNLACTVMVPWPCKYRCSFCTTRFDYELCTPNYKKVIETINNLGRTVLFNTGMIKEFIITGGEPFGEIYGLLSIVNSLSIYNLPIYVNTVLPANNIIGNPTACKQIFKTVKGVNVSRHLTDRFTVVEGPNENSVLNANVWRDRIDKEKIRVNSVVTEDDFTEQIKDRISRFVEIYRDKCNHITFRADYTKIKTLDDLKSLNDPFFRVLASLYPYEGSSGCAVCNDDKFGFISYHRGLAKTLINISENKYLIHDIIIRPDGEVWPDWVRPSDSIMQAFSSYLINKKDFERVFSPDLQFLLLKRKAANEISRNGYFDVFSGVGITKEDWEKYTEMAAATGYRTLALDYAASTDSARSCGRLSCGRCG